MLVSNYYKILRAISERNYQFATKSYSGVWNDSRFCYSTTYASRALQSANDVAGTNLTDGTLYADNAGVGTVVVVCGNGTTAVTAEDTCLDSDNTSSFTTVSTSCSVGLTGSSITRTFSRTLRNDTSNDLTISEVGVVKGTQMSFDGHLYFVLIERTLLDSEVVVKSGKTATVQIAITEGSDSVVVS